MSEDVLGEARSALAVGQADEALRLAWKATMPAVLRQDVDQLAASSAFAGEVAAGTAGATQKEARQYAAYWAACIEEPRDRQVTAWSFKSWFRRALQQTRYPCPQCAELILVDAKVCRFCGHVL